MKAYARMPSANELAGPRAGSRWSGSTMSAATRQSSEHEPVTQERELGRLERFPQPREEIGLFAAAGDSYALECAVELHVDIDFTGILVEVQERPGPREK